MSSADIVPAPWTMTGDGYLIAIRCNRAFAQSCIDDTPGFNGRALGGLGAVMIIDYATSDVGPYRELLLCPGLIRSGRRKVRAITHDWVSTQSSAANGRRNWGLPKQEAIFRVDQNPDGGETFTVHRNEHPPLQLTLTPRGLTLPVNTKILPRRLRTLDQPWQGRSYQTAIRAKGRAQRCSLTGYDNPPASGFPDFSGQKRQVGVAAHAFELTFPEPHIAPLTEC